MDIQVLSFINGRETRLITMESSTQLIRELTSEFCRKANISPEDQYKVSLYYQARILEPSAKICDCNLYQESAVTAVLRKDAPPPEPTVREIDYPAPPLPTNDKYFVYCAKHAPGKEVNKAGLRPYCTEDRSSSVFISSDKEIKTWEDVLNPKGHTFECYSTENPICKTKSNASIGYYFVCQGDFVSKKWKEEDYRHHPDEVNERRQRSVCKSYSFCKKSSFSLVDLIERQGKVLVRYNPCGHEFTFDTAKEAYQQHSDISNIILKNTNANHNLFGKYLIACPGNGFKCNGAILLSTMKVINPTLYGAINTYTVGLDYSFVECHSQKHTEVNRRFQLLEKKQDATCPTCRAVICVACGSDWGNCDHSRTDSSYAAKILDIALNTYRRCPDCNVPLTTNAKCPEHYTCYYCLGECDDDPDLCPERDVEILKQDALWDLHREYSSDSNILAKVWEQLVRAQGNSAWNLWEQAKERGAFRPQ